MIRNEYFSLKMNFIICSGILRSASTWAFNVCRLIASSLAKQNNLPLLDCGYKDTTALDELLKKNGSGIAVVKTHAPSKFALEFILTGAVKNICTIRDPRDCVASQQLFHDDETFEQSVYLLKNNLHYVDIFMLDELRDVVTDSQAKGREE